jgi:hypothetical protein
VSPSYTLTLSGTGITNNSGVAQTFVVAGSFAEEGRILFTQNASAVTGNDSLNGFLDPVLLNGFVPTIGQTFTFLDYASLTSEFFNIKHRVFDNGLLQWAVPYENTTAMLTVESRTTIPDQSSTFPLLTLGLLGLVTYRRQLLRGAS